jgi:preprotein translocase SecE subunit
MNKILQGLKEYFDGVKLEFRRISWPNRTVLKQLIFFVLALTIMLALFAGVIDAAFSKIVQLFLGKFQIHG